MDRIYTLLILAFLVAGCASGRKQLTKGNYEQSITQAVNRLRDSPNNNRAKDALKEAYPLARDLYLNRIAQAKASTDRFKWDQIAESYDLMNSYYEMIQRCPACLEVLPPIMNYAREYEDASKLAASERYQAGLEELKVGTRDAAIQAYRHFQRVQYLRPDYLDTRDRLEESLYMATLKVVVNQIPVHSRNFGLSNEYFQNRIYEFLLGDRLNEFVRFYTPAEADREQLEQPDHYVILQFDDFVVGQTLVTKDTRLVERDSVVVGQVEIDGESKDVFGKVEAEFITFSKVVDSRGLMDLQIFDARTDRILFQRKMPGSFEWVAEWATYKGDKRALTDEEYELTRLDEPPPPNPQWLFEQFSAPICDQAIGHFRSFYGRY